MAVAPVEWIDSHCHLQGSFAAERAADDLIEKARAAGVVQFVCVGCDLASSREAVELARREPDVWASVGLHPHDGSRLAAEWDGLAALARDASDVVVGIGEAGFDLYYRHSEPAEQEAAFCAQIALAHELDRALVIHSRDAWEDTFRVLAREGVPERTVFHCFTGGPAEAEQALALGAHLSFSGIVSFKAADDLRAAAARTPPDRLLVETDTPYLAPVPHRGSPNEPAFVVDVGRALAAACAMEAEQLAGLTSANARRVFRLP